MNTTVQSNNIGLTICSQLLPNSILTPITCYSTLLTYLMFDPTNYNIDDKFTTTVINKTGHGTTQFNNGQKNGECDFVNGKLCGHFVAYYDNKQKYEEYDYVDDILNGHYISYYNNGQVETISDHINEKLNGHSISY